MDKVMKKLIAFVALTVSALFFSLCAFAEDSEFAGGVQLRLKNSLTEKIDYYFTPPGDKPKLAGSLEAGAVIDVKSKPGIVWLFAQDRKPFQKYTTREEVFQQLIIAPVGQQKKPVVANAYQPALKGGKKATGTADASTTKPATKKPTASAAEPEDPSGMKWTAAEYEADGGGTVAELGYGVPQTDQVQFYATCSAETAGAAHVIIGFDVSDKPIGQSTRIRIVGTGFDRTFPGQIYHSQSSEGMQGAEFELPLDEPIWDSLKSVSSVRYNVGGKGAATLPLAGIKAPLGEFLQKCTAIGGGSEEVATFDARTLFGGKVAAADDDSCAALRGKKSTNDGQPVGVTFVNRTDEYRVLDWIDFQGRPIQYAQIEPGQEFEVQTFIGHPWMASDGPGNCIEMFMPSPDQPVIELTRKSPGFGDE
jgi:hypothetical protein